MCGIGPFVPHRDTPFAAEAPGTVELTCYLLSLVRLAHPTVLLPATTALEALGPRSREKGILAGADGVIPNLAHAARAPGRLRAATMGSPARRPARPASGPTWRRSLSPWAAASW